MLYLYRNEKQTETRRVAYRDLHNCTTAQGYLYLTTQLQKHRDLHLVKRMLKDTAPDRCIGGWLINSLSIIPDD